MGAPELLDLGVIQVEIHRFYVVLKTNLGVPFKVIGDTGQGYLAAYDSVEEYKEDIW